jgi:hypothetical protein
MNEYPAARIRLFVILFVDGGMNVGVDGTETHSAKGASVHELRHE